jgi:hypothetical protein
MADPNGMRVRPNQPMKLTGPASLPFENQHRSRPGNLSFSFTFNKEGYQTLNFIPSIATMLLGPMAGERLRRSDRPEAKRV